MRNFGNGFILLLDTINMAVVAQQVCCSIQGAGVSGKKKILFVTCSFPSKLS